MAPPTSGSAAPVHKRLILANPRGFCAGVERAITAVEDAVDYYGAPVFVRRHIVHNQAVVDRLEALGAKFVAELDEVPEGAVAILSAYGVAPVIHCAARHRRLRTVDTAIPGGQSRIGMAAIKAQMGGVTTAFDAPREPGMFSLPPRFRLAEAGHGL